MLQQIQRPEFEAIASFWTELLGERGLPQAVHWVFHEDVARLSPTIGGLRFAFRPRPVAAADQVARFAYAHLNPKYPLAIVACAVLDGTVFTGLQGDVWTADGDVYRNDWNIYFDAKDHITSDCEIVSDDEKWNILLQNQPLYASEFDYLVSTHALQRDFGYTGQP